MSLRAILNVAYASLVEGLSREQREQFDARLAEQVAPAPELPAGVIDPRRLAPNQLQGMLAAMQQTMGMESA